MNVVRYFCLSLSLITKNDWFIPSPLRSSASIRTLFGSLRYLSANLKISAGIVADHNEVILLSGTRSNTNSISSMNPISNITSASSSAKNLILFSLTVPLLI